MNCFSIVVTAVLSTAFWPTSAIPLVAAVLLPVALRAGLPPMGAILPIAAFSVLLIGLICGINGSGFAGLPITGALYHMAMGLIRRCWRPLDRWGRSGQGEERLWPGCCNDFCGAHLVTERKRMGLFPLIWMHDRCGRRES